MDTRFTGAEYSEGCPPGKVWSNLIGACVDGTGCPSGMEWVSGKGCVKVNSQYYRFKGGVEDNDCGYWECTAWCLLKTAGGGKVKSGIVGLGLEEVAKRLTKESAKKAVSPFIPVYNAISGVVLVSDASSCFIGCNYNKEYRGFVPD